MKATSGTKLTGELAHKLRTVGEQIKYARLRRNLSKELVCQRAMITAPTLTAVESGCPTVSFGIYLRILNALQLADDILLIAKDDELGRQLQDAGIATRKRASKQRK